MGLGVGSGAGVNGSGDRAAIVGVGPVATGGTGAPGNKDAGGSGGRVGFWTGGITSPPDANSIFLFLVWIA